MDKNVLSSGGHSSTRHATVAGILHCYDLFHNQIGHLNSLRLILMIKAIKSTISRDSDIRKMRPLRSSARSTAVVCPLFIKFIYSAIRPARSRAMKPSIIRNNCSVGW